MAKEKTNANEKISSELVRGFEVGVEKRNGKRAEFLNSSISFPASTVTVQSLFIKKAERAAGKTTANAEQVFCSLKFVNGDNSLNVNDDWSLVNEDFQSKGKNLLREDGKSIEQMASIVNGKYEVVA